MTSLLTGYIYLCEKIPKYSRSASYSAKVSHSSWGELSRMSSEHWTYCCYLLQSMGNSKRFLCSTFEKESCSIPTPILRLHWNSLFQQNKGSECTWLSFFRISDKKQYNKQTISIEVLELSCSNRMCCSWAARAENEGLFDCIKWYVAFKLALSLQVLENIKIVGTWQLII